MPGSCSEHWESLAQGVQCPMATTKHLAWARPCANHSSALCFWILTANYPGTKETLFFPFYRPKTRMWKALSNFPKATRLVVSRAGHRLWALCFQSSQLCTLVCTHRGTDKSQTQCGEAKCNLNEHSYWGNAPRAWDYRGTDRLRSTSDTFMFNNAKWWY